MKKYLLISYFASNSIALTKLKAQWKNSNKKYLGRTKQETEEVTNDQLGGMIVALDLESINSGVVRKLDIPVPMGMSYDPKTESLLVASDYDVFSVKNGSYTTYLSHPLFNNLHSIHTENGKLYITSTGIDSILTFQNKKLVHKWCAIENGYPEAPNGNKALKVDWEADYRNEAIPTSAQSTHINSAIPLGEKYLLATLFHQGTLVKINLQTNESETLVQGFKSLHNIRRGKTGFIFSDTMGARVIRLDSDFTQVGELKGDFNWVQDAVEVSDQTFVADSNNGRVVCLGAESQLLNQYTWNPDELKVGGLVVIDQNQLSKVFGS